MRNMSIEMQARKKSIKPPSTTASLSGEERRKKLIKMSNLGFFVKDLIYFFSPLDFLI